MQSKIDKYFELRDEINEEYGVDPWYLIEDHRDYFWFMDDTTVYFGEEKEFVSIEEKEAEYMETISSSIHVRKNLVRQDYQTIVCIDSSCGGDPYYIVFDDLKNMEIING